MALPVTIPNTFANATSSIPLANLDANFVTIYGAVNGIGNGSEALANVSISGGAISNTSVSATTLNTSGQVVFNDAGADVDFRVEGDTDANLLFVDASADAVGIGTNVPTKLLHLSSPGPSPFLIDRTSGTANTSVEYKNTGGSLFAGIGDSQVFTVGDGLDLTSAAGNEFVQFGRTLLRFHTNNTERMRIDSAGNVGIGTSLPISELNLSNPFNGNGLSMISWKQAGVDNNNYNIFPMRGGSSLHLARGLKSSTSVSDVFESSRGGSINRSSVAVTNNGIQMFTDVASDVAEGTAITPTERMRIDSAGNVLVGTTAAPRGKIDLVQSGNTRSGFFECTNASFTDDVMNFNAIRNTTNGTYNFLKCSISNVAAKLIIADSGNVTNINNSYGQISDIKTKQDIVDAASQWDDIKNIRVRKFRFKDTPTGPLQIGVVAQELEEVSPGLIDERPDYEEVTRTREVEKTRVVTEAVLDEDSNEIEPAVTETYTEEEEYTERVALDTTTKSVKYSVLYMKAVKALQEAIERIETLEAKVAALEAQ